MLVLAFCVVANILIAICFKMFFRKGVNSFIAIIVNYWVCLTLGSLLVGHVPILTYGIETKWVPFGLALGTIFIIGFNITAQSVRFTGMTITSVMMKMSLLMSSAYAIVFFAESAGIPKLLGIMMAAIAVVLINATPGAGSSGIRPGPYTVYPILTLVLSGFIEIILYHVQVTGLALNADAELTTFAFSVAAVLGAVIVIWLYLTKRKKFQWKDYYWGIALGVPNFFSIYLILVMLKHGFEGSVLFPVLNISVLVSTALVGLLAFSEKLRPVNLVGIGLAILAILSIMLY